MEDNKERIIKMIFSVVDEINRQLSQENRLSKTLDTVIFGPGAELDSLGFIIFIVALEQKVEEEFKKTVLMDNIEISKKDNPFRSISVLADCINLRLNGK